MTRLFLAFLLLLGGCVVRTYHYPTDPVTYGTTTYYYENDGTWVETYYARNGQFVVCRHHRHGMVCHAR